MILRPGTGAGEALVLTHPISFWGGVDPARGDISMSGTPSAANRRRRVLLLPGTIGSSSAAAVLLELVHAGQAPAAIVLHRAGRHPAARISWRARMGWQRPPPCACRWSGSGRWRDA